MPPGRVLKAGLAERSEYKWSSENSEPKSAARAALLLAFSRSYQKEDKKNWARQGSLFSPFLSQRELEASIHQMKQTDAVSGHRSNFRRTLRGRGDSHLTRANEALSRDLRKPPAFREKLRVTAVLCRKLTSLAETLWSPRSEASQVLSRAVLGLARISEQEKLQLCLGRGWAVQK